MEISNKDFVHLHVHSEYSKFDGLATIKGLVAKAREMGFPALAITDHGNVGSFIKFIKECKATKDKNDKLLKYPPIKPILGVELYFCRKHTAKSKAEQPEERFGNSHIVLLAKNWDGYQNLCTLDQIGYTQGFWYDPRIDFDLLAKHSKGLICSTACLGGIINKNLLHDRYDQAKKAAGLFKDIFKEDFFMEVMFHGMAAERSIIPDIFKLSKELDIPVIATNDCISGDSMIVTGSGLKSATEVKAGDFLLTHNGRMRRVEFVNRRKSNNIYTVHGYMGGELIRATGNHPILVGMRKRSGTKNVIRSLQWISVQDLTPNHYFAIPKIHSEDIFCSASVEQSHIDVLKYYDIKKYRRSSFMENDVEYVYSGRCMDKNIRIPRCLPLDKAFFEVLGLYIAEGCVSTDGLQQLNFGLHKDEIHLKKKLVDFFSSFGLHPSVRCHGNGVWIRVVSTVFAELFSKLCGNSSSQKHMPILENRNSFFGCWTRDQVSYILSTYIEGDGHEPLGRKAISIASTSKTLIFEISAILNALGILSLPTERDYQNRNSFKEWKHKNPNAKSSNWNNTFILHISGNNKFILQRWIHRHKNQEVLKGKQNYCEDDNYYYVKIKKIKSIENEMEVYNFQVAEDESYTVNFVSVHNCHYIEKKHAKSQEVLMCMSSSKCMHDPKRPKLPTEEFYLKSANEMYKMFQVYPQVITNTVALANRIDNKDIDNHLFGGMRLPKFGIPEQYETPFEYLKFLAIDGLKKLNWDKSKPHVEALRKELIDVKVALDNNNYDFSTYFLIVRDIIQFAKSKEIMCGAGRGSGYASILLRCLGITYGVDPIEYELLWERFLGFDSAHFIKTTDFF